MNKLVFMDDVWFQYLDLHDEDPKVWKRLNRLIRESLRTPFEGTGKPEPLKENLSGYWSRRVTKEHRLIYRVKDGALEIISCVGHYED